MVIMAIGKEEVDCQARRIASLESLLQNTRYRNLLIRCSPQPSWEDYTRTEHWKSEVPCHRPKCAHRSQILLPREEVGIRTNHLGHSTCGTGLLPQGEPQYHTRGLSFRYCALCKGNPQ